MDKKIFNIEDFVKVGQEIEVSILGIDVENQRIALGHKQLTENPWDKLAEEFKVGTEVDCKVMKAIDKGIIVELPSVVDCFIPASSWRYANGTLVTVSASAELKSEVVG
jgi:small subunit ribosomal protein S1